MRFICDVHIAYKLMRYLRDRGCECNHVNFVFTDPRTSDVQIAQFADKNNLIVITKDNDYRDSYLLKRSPKKLVRLNAGNSSTAQMIALFENNWEVLVEANRHQHFFIESDVFFFYLIEIDNQT